MTDEATTVLLVEDEESFVDAPTIGLGHEGFRVEVARDGAEALRRFAEIEPDLVLLDLMLPKVSGLDMCRELRQISQVPIIMVTAKGDEVGDVRLDVARHQVTERGRRVDLPLKEFDLLTVLLARAGRVVPRDRLIEQVWGYDHVGDTKTLDVHVKRLRSKVETDPANPTRIVTVRGVGYRYEAPHLLH